MAILSTGFEQQFDDGIRNLNAMDDFDPEYIVSQGSDGTMGQIRPYQIQTEQRLGVNDSNIALSGNGNMLVAFTAITADRTVTLPSSPVANQRIGITDESGKCSNARRIIVVPSGGATISGDSFAALVFPNGSGFFVYDGVGKWTIYSTTSIQYSAGVQSMPTITDNGNGSVTLGTGIYSLFANTGGQGRPKAYQVAGGTFTFTDNSTNFIYADYNTSTGVVSLQQTTNESILNDLTQIKIYAAYRQGTTLHARNFDSWGLALVNKLNTSIYKTQRIRFEEGAAQVGESATPAVRTITISGGKVWIAAAENTLTTLTSAANTCYHVIQTSPGVWNTTTTVTQYNNTQYNTTAGLVTLTNNNYAVNWIYRSVGTDNDMAIVLGGGDYTLGQAQTSAKPTNLPTFLSHMELVGRIIVKKNDNTATQIDNVSSTFFSSAGVTDHQALLNLQTAQTGVTYGHITDAAQTIVGDKTLLGLSTFQGTTATDGGQLGSDIAGATTATGTNWAGTNFSGGYTHTIGSTTDLVGTLAATSSTSYQIIASITGRTTGTAIVSFGGFSSNSISSTTTFYGKSTSVAVLTITPTTDFNGTIAIDIRPISVGSALISYKNSSGSVVGEYRGDKTSNNIFLGVNSGVRNITGANNIGIGHSSLQNILSGIQNIAIGVSGLNSATTASQSTAVGHSSLSKNVTGTNSTAIGFSALNNNLGSYNTAVGSSSMFLDNASSTNNTSVGALAMYNSIGGNENTAIGGASLTNLGTGQHNNTAIGSASGFYLADGTTLLTTTTQSCFLGRLTKASANGNTNEIVIGYNAIGNGTNTATIGNSSVTDTYLQGQRLNIRNVAKTFWGTITHTITAARTWTMPDATGTVALTSNPTSISATSLQATNGTIRLFGYTVATLPAGTIGDQAYVTDASAPSFGVAVVGGGAVVTPVFYNGTTWIVR